MEPDSLQTYLYLGNEVLRDQGSIEYHHGSSMALTTQLRHRVANIASSYELLQPTVLVYLALL